MVSDISIKIKEDLNFGTDPPEKDASIRTGIHPPTELRITEMVEIVLVGVLMGDDTSKVKVFTDN